MIGRRAHKLKPEDNWRDVVRGLTLANDISARDLQKKDVQWTRAKGFDTFCPVGPIVSDELDLDAGLTIETFFIGWIRPEAKFPSLDALKAQIAADAEKAREILRDSPPPSPLA